MKIIKLRPNGEAKVDDDDYEWLQHLIWRKNPLHGYAYNPIGSIQDGKRKSVAIYMHRMIMDPCDPFHVDHINGDRLDNRKKNLRLVLPAENMWNRDKNRVKKYSQYFGVSFAHDSKVWTATMTTPQGKHIRLGRYNTEIEAAIAYDIASEKHWGENARLNFPTNRPDIIPMRRTIGPTKTLTMQLDDKYHNAKIIIRHPNRSIRELIKASIINSL